MIITIQTEDFDVAEVTAALCQQRKDIGAIVSFCGRVRDLSQQQSLLALELEHYPGMTEKAITDIADRALKRWRIDDLAVIHRVGRLTPTDNIVLVVVISAHRNDAFEACHFLMDYLKTEAPLWKKEITQEGESWVEARQSDQHATERWRSDVD